jgi:hypothetical protein
VAQPWTWIFQSTPGEWLLREALAEEPRLLWKVSRYKNDINVGDTVWMWESGRDACLLARCTVTSRPRLQPADPRYEKYVVDPKYREDMWRAGLRVERVFDKPLPREELVADESLAALPPIGGPTTARRGTNFSVKPPEAAILEAMANGR